MSRSASAAPRSPATVEKRANMSVFLPTEEKMLAFVYAVMSCVVVKVPNAPEPFACMRRSGITSRSKWASFSRNQTSWSSIGPRGPAVIAFWLSGTGAPPAVVSFFFSVMTCFSLCLAAARESGPSPSRTRWGRRPRLHRRSYASLDRAPAIPGTAIRHVGIAGSNPLAPTRCPRAGRSGQARGRGRSPACSTNRKNLAHRDFRYRLRKPALGETHGCPHQREHDRHLDERAHHRRQGNRRREGRDRYCNGDLEIATRGVEGDRHRVPIWEVQSRPDEEHDEEEDRKEEGHRDRHFQNDAGPLQDQVALQREHDDQGEQQPQNRKGVESRLVSLHRLFTTPAGY